jgi:hypothetical protein
VAARKILIQKDVVTQSKILAEEKTLPQAEVSDDPVIGHRAQTRLGEESRVLAVVKGIEKIAGAGRLALAVDPQTEAGFAVSAQPAVCLRRPAGALTFIRRLTSFRRLTKKPLMSRSLIVYCRRKIKMSGFQPESGFRGRGNCPEKLLSVAKLGE